MPFFPNCQTGHNYSRIIVRKKKKIHAIKMNTVRERFCKRNVAEKSGNLCMQALWSETGFALILKTRCTEA